MTPRQCEIAAESFAASLLARAGYDILVQYGANQPHYDLVAVKEKRILLISVKGSQDGGWMLASRYVKKGVSYQPAIDQWLANQRSDIVFMFIQFKDVSLLQAPRAYIVRPPAIAKALRKRRGGKGGGTLQEDWRRDHPRSSCTDKLPSSWRFSLKRIATI